jgi:hypothetical protein
MLSKFLKKSAQKLLIFTIKAGYARGLFRHFVENLETEEKFECALELA